MFKKINNNPILGIVFIIISFCVFFYFLSGSEQTENIEKMDVVNNIFDNTFSSVLNSDNEKIINFKCTLDGVEYFLANIQTPQDPNNLKSKNSPEIECGSTIMVLIPVDDINKSLDNYVNKLNIKMAICDFTEKVNCISRLPKMSSDSNKETCNKLTPRCSHKRNFIHDFIIQKVENNSNPQKYIIRGTNEPSMGNSTTPTMLNQILFYDKGEPILCGDNYSYGNPTFKNEWAEVMVSERVINNSPIVGTNPDIKIKLVFKTQQILINTDNNTKKKTYLPWPVNKPNIMTSYVGLCNYDDINIKLPYISLNENTKYKRVCLISENLASTNPEKILEFTPLIVNVPNPESRENFTKYC